MELALCQQARGKHEICGNSTEDVKEADKAEPNQGKEAVIRIVIETGIRTPK